MYIWQSVKNVKIIGFRHFLGHYTQIEGEFGSRTCTRGPLSFQGKNWNIFPDIPRKMTVIPVLSLLFHPFLPKNWFPYLNKNYIFEISDNRAIIRKSFIMLS